MLKLVTEVMTIVSNVPATAAQNGPADNALAATHNDLDARRSALGKEIGQGLADGTLTSEEGSMLLSESGRISSQLLQFRQAGLSPAQHQTITDQLDALSNTLKQERADADRAP